MPYGKWTASYKDYLMSMCGKGDIKSFTEHHTTESVLFKIVATQVFDIVNIIIHVKLLI